MRPRSSRYRRGNLNLLRLWLWSWAVVAGLTAGCARQHGAPQDAIATIDAESDASPRAQFQFGIIVDSPVSGAFREFIFADEPLACDAITYYEPNSTGWIRSTAKWLTIIRYGEFTSATLHDNGTAIGPDSANVTLQDGDLAIGDTTHVDWSVNWPELFVASGTATAIYCGRGILAN